MQKEKKLKSLKLMSSRNRRDLMCSETKAEKAAQDALRELGVSFIRQYPIKTPRKTFYADIYIPSARLVLEIDGGYHTTEYQKRLDANRSNCIRRMGYHVYRLSNRDAYRPATVRNKILSLLR